jgi:membrane protease YdiL (CAAX protease family)
VGRKPYPGIVQAIFLVVLLLVLQLIIGLAIYFGGKYLAPGVTAGDALSDAAVLGIGSLLTFAIIIAWGVRRTRLPMSRALPFAKPKTRGAIYPPLIVVIVGLGIVNSELVNLVNAVLPMPGSLTRMFEKLTSGGLATVLAFILIAPVMEELLFRGIILRGFLARYRPGTAIAVSALLFALVHLNPYQFVAALITGVIFGWLFVRTGSLRPCIIGHGLYNGYLLLVHTGLLRAINGAHDPLAMEFQPLWLDATGLVLAGFGLLALARALRPARTSAYGT